MTRALNRQCEPVGKARRLLLPALVLAGLGCAMLPAPALAQDDARLRRIEAEIRALQRQVFPNGDGRFFTPEVVTPDGSERPQQQIGTPSSSALTDILTRLQSLEAQLAQLTARGEENDNEIRQLRERLDQLEQARVVAPPVVAPPTGVIQPPASPPRGGTPAPGPAPAPSASAPSPERLAAVQAIEKPATGDAGGDEYTYGFRLWEAKLYPEARQQLSLFLERFPSHPQKSFGRNLLGRAYLDDGDARNAATQFLQNYTEDKQGGRAGDSLLYLAESMIALGDTSRACIALASFGDEYPALATGRLQAQYERNRGRVTCS